MTISINSVIQGRPSEEDYGRAVQDITELKTIGPSERFDQQQAYVEDEVRPYWFDLQDATAESLPTIVQPNDAPATGRWIRLPPEGGGVPAAHKDSHVTGSDKFVSTDLIEVIIKRLRETDGPTTLLLGAIADGEFLKRVGTDIVGMAAAAATQKSQFFAGQLDLPINPDWVVNALAPGDADPLNAALTVHAHDDTIEEGIGIPFVLPSGVTQVEIFQQARAVTAPGAVRTVGRKLYYRKIPDNLAVSVPWTGAGDGSKILDDVDIPTNAFFQTDTQILTLASFAPALVAGDSYLFEVTRVAPVGGTNLAGDWDLWIIGLLFS